MLAMLFLSLLFSLYLSSIINRRLRNYQTQIKESNEKLLFQSRQALIGELLPMIAHQWRQPINRINAVDASDPHGEITIDLFEKDHVVKIVVTDHGKGIKQNTSTKFLSHISPPRKTPWDWGFI